jgi:peptidoglycan/xylan/chitin deacetylase (PgdA/CDA1 family)
MRIRGIGRLKRELQRLRSLIQRRAVILLYHRVAEVSPDPQLLCVNPRHFEEHLEILRLHYRPMSLCDLKEMVDCGRIPYKAVVISFDDGYADNLYTARPLLERYNIPAVVFVTSGYLGQSREFWWDELERVFLTSAKLPESLRLTIQGETYSWRVGETGPNGETSFNPGLPWNVTMESYPTPRHRTYCKLHFLFRTLDYETRERLLIQIAQWAGVSRDGRPSHRTLRADEIPRLSEGKLVDIGAHSVTHPVLAVEPLEVQRKEIIGCKRQLEGILGRPVKSFSYPYGGSGDVGRETIALVREAGYQVACANFPMAVTSRFDPYWVSRCLVRDWDGEEFARRLRAFFTT